MHPGLKSSLMKRAPISFRDKLRYRFENTLSAGPIAIIGWLAVVSLLIVLIAATVLFFTHLRPDGEASGYNYFEAMWQSMMRAMDAGTLAGDSGWKARALMFAVTIGGIFIVSILIGTITSGLESRLEELRKGRSRVVESSHTLILGWSPKIFSIINELIIANSNQRKPRIVIMADRDKVEMEDEIKSKFPNTRNTRIICRTGSPLDLDDLEVVNPHEAKSIIILSPENAENPDTHVIKSVLAVTNNPKRKADAYHLVAEIRDPRNMEAAELVGNNEACFVLAGDLIARVTAQTCRQSGLSVVYTELLDFDGAELYFKNETALAGKTYRYALSSYEDSALIGLMRNNGDVLLNPPMDTLFEKGDQIIAISEDDDTIVLAQRTPPAPDTDAIRQGSTTPAGIEDTLILGWNEKGIDIIRELDNYVGAGSSVTVICETEGIDETLRALQPQLSKISVKHETADITERATLDKANVASFHHIIILCYNLNDIQEADAKTLIALLHLRNLSEQAGRPFSIVSEMLDIRNRSLAEVARADDFIVSDKLISLMLSQLSENKHLEKVFRDLFSSEGSEIYLKPISDYVATGRSMNFYTLIEAAAERGETAIGYRITADGPSPEKAYGVHINPKKSEMLTFADEDKIIVLAEN